MSRMSVDLPEPLAPRIPWMSPRSRRIDTCEIAVTGVLLPADDEPLADVLDEEGGRAVGRTVVGWTGSTARPGVGRSVESLFSCGFRVAVTWSAPGAAVRGVGGWSGNAKEPRAPTDVSRRWASRLLVSGPAGGQGRASKKPGARSGPRLVVRPEGGPAACGLARDGHRSPVHGAAIGATHRWRSSVFVISEPPPLEVDLRPRLASRSAVYPPRETGVNPDRMRSRRSVPVERQPDDRADRASSRSTGGARRR